MESVAWKNHEGHRTKVKARIKVRVIYLLVNIDVKCSGDRFLDWSGPDSEELWNGHLAV